MNKGLFRLTAFFLYLISLLPFPLLYLFSDLLFFLLYYVIRYRREVVQANLANSFPEKTLKERRSIERRFYRYLADMIFESIKTISITPSEMRKRYKFENIIELTRHLNAGRSVIAVTGHYGNWEWGPLAIGLELEEKILVVDRKAHV